MDSFVLFSLHEIDGIPKKHMHTTALPNARRDRNSCGLQRDRLAVHGSRTASAFPAEIRPIRGAAHGNHRETDCRTLAYFSSALLLFPSVVYYLLFLPMLASGGKHYVIQRSAAVCVRVPRIEQKQSELFGCNRP